MFHLGKRRKLIMVYVCAIIFALGGFSTAEPLHEAAKEGDLIKIKSLIAEGSNVNIVDENGTTPLHFAADRSHIDVVELLISKGANVNANKFRWTLIAWAGQAQTTDTPEILKARKEVIELLPRHGAHK